MNSVTKWMSWKNGIYLVAQTSPDLQTPNIIIHLGYLVHTPVGSAPSGIILWQPDPNIAPRLLAL